MSSDRVYKRTKIVLEDVLTKIEFVLTTWILAASFNNYEMATTNEKILDIILNEMKILSFPCTNDLNFDNHDIVTIERTRRPPQKQKY